MANIRYNNVSIEPAPSYSISHNFTRYGNGDILSKMFTINLRGYIVPTTGGVSFYEGAYNTNDYFEYSVRKINELRNLFSETHHVLEIIDNSNNVVISCRPVSIEVNVDDSYYVNPVGYQVTLNTPLLSSLGASSSIEETSNYYLMRATDTLTASYQNNQLSINRNIEAQGINVNGNDAHLYASSWCWERYNDTTYINSLFNAMNNTLATEFSSIAINGININTSETEGTYQIQAIYTAVQDTSNATIDTWTLNCTYGDDGYLTASVNYTVEGIGNSADEKYANAKNRFSSPITQIYNIVSSYIPSNSEFSNYETLSYVSISDITRGSIQHNIEYYIGSGQIDSLRRISCNYSIDESTGDFTITANGSFSNVADSSQVMPIPSYSDIVSLLHSKGILSEDISPYVYKAIVTKTYEQASATQSWTMNIKGNVLQSSAGAVIIDINRTWNIDIISKMEKITENITLTPSRWVFSGITPDYGYINTLQDSLSDELHNILHGEYIPSSIAFSGLIQRQPSQSIVNISEVKFGDEEIGYNITREWSYIGWDLTPYIPVDYPLRNINISIRRKFDTKVYRQYTIPGRAFGPLFQNLQTRTLPTIDMSISLDIGDTTIGNSLFNTTNRITSPGTEQFVSDISLSELSDSILRQMLNLPDLRIDKYDINYHLDGTQCAVVLNEEDEYDPINFRLNYRCTYGLVNIGYR